MIGFLFKSFCWIAGASFAALVLAGAVNANDPAFAVLAGAGLVGAACLWMV